MLKKAKEFVKRDLVLIIALVLAAVSSIFHTPNANCIDYDVLAILFSLMLVVAGLVSSQFISNVPAAMLLAGLTNQADALLVGVNVGGLGTLIASMASVISYKFFTQKYPSLSFGYLKAFTMYNVVGLIFIGVCSYLWLLL